MHRIRVSFSFPWPFDSLETGELLTWLFQVALLSYLGFYLIESLRPGFVTYYFNLNILLYSTIVIGILTTVWPAAVSMTKGQKTSLRWDQLFWTSVIAAVGAALVWYKTQPLGRLSGPIAVLSGLTIFSLGLLVYTDHDAQSED